jgi:hypothetical protein
MLYAMEPELHKFFEKMSAFETITDIKAVFAPQARGRGMKLLSFSSPPRWKSTGA